MEINKFKMNTEKCFILNSYSITSYEKETDVNHRMDSMEKIHNNQLGVVEWKQAEMMTAPVSYTHLDVYKRQYGKWGG